MVFCNNADNKTGSCELPAVSVIIVAFASPDFDLTIAYFVNEPVGFIDPPAV